ncbi:MAG TPA: hypothetical protein VGL17_02005 [Gemmatimonadaceae bacterium]|jgi:hypothetical protein
MKKRTDNEHGPRHVTPAGRSVFYDLGFDEAEARVLEMRADQMAALREHIEKRGWTQSEGRHPDEPHPPRTNPRHRELHRNAQHLRRKRDGGVSWSSAHLRTSARLVNSAPRQGPHSLHKSRNLISPLLPTVP